MAASRFPVSDPLPSIWTAQPHPLDNYRSSSALPAKCEVLIVGSGFAGVATAYHLMNSRKIHGPIVLVDARKHCSGATGRNGGHIKPDPYYNFAKYERLYGATQAAELAEFETSHVYAVKQLVESEELDCDFQLTRSIDVYLDRDHADQTIEAYRLALKKGAIEMKDVALTTAKDAERVSGVKGAQACFSFTAASLWPRKLVHQLLGRLIDQGVQAYANTPVTSIAQSSDHEGCWSITTPTGSITARKVVFATNGFTSAILPQYAGKIVPVRGACCHITTSLGRNAPHLPNTYALRFGGNAYDYLIPRADGSIVVGGGRQAFMHRKEQWFDSVREGELLPDTEAYFTDYMQRHFRGWENTDAKIERIWAGVMGYSSDFVPHVGEIPDSPGQYIIAGFSGHGMPQILKASQGLSNLITGGATSYEDTGLPLIFKSTNERLTKQRSEMEEGFSSDWLREEGRTSIIQCK
ncbi:DAO-domain-containing protein [Myriangium duriaei CBS 260.36]|uniref:DAO-domain-containing protein n=1 Tax=Myriangium duriaei CBS 260.36 TaxID=1168546 RepID=A0A9P4JDV4_9PEZI|nr:DAO-domain-containing protein [Myriangium duriaei CBS 260.36]